MKTLLACIALCLFMFPVFSQKIVYLENKHQLEVSRLKKIKPWESEEMSKGVWKDRAKIGKMLQRDFVKNKNIKKLEDDLISLDYRMFVNESNQVDSAYFWFTSFKIEHGKDNKTKYTSEYQTIEDVNFIETSKRILQNIIKENELYYNPKMAYEIYSSFRVNQSVSKSENSASILSEKLSLLGDTIKVLKLIDLGLKNIGNEISRFKNLEELDLSKNEFESFKFNPKKFPKLKKIGLSDNFLNENTIRIRRNKQIQIINLSNNHISNFPKKIHKNRRLKDLHLANNYISKTEIIKFQRLKSLELLNFYDNRLNELSDNIGKLSNLQVLDLYRNNLLFLPNSISKLQKLETLAVSNNKLWEIPESFSELSSLKVLYAHHNKLSSVKSLPPNLENLDLGFNLLETVPESLRKANKLTNLDISYNKIKSGASLLPQIPKLKNVALSFNDFESDPTKFAELQQIIVDLEKKSVSVK